MHFIAGDSPAATNALAYTSSEWQLTTPTCTTNSDTTVDCLISSSFTPAVPGARSTPLAVNSSDGNTAFLALTGHRPRRRGHARSRKPNQLWLQPRRSPASQPTTQEMSMFRTRTASKLLRFAPAAIAQGASATSTTLGNTHRTWRGRRRCARLRLCCRYVRGHVSRKSRLQVLSATLPFKFTNPAGLAVDALNNLYVSDSAAQSVYQIIPLPERSARLPSDRWSHPLVSPSILQETCSSPILAQPLSTASICNSSTHHGLPSCGRKAL